MALPRYVIDLKKCEIIGHLLKKVHTLDTSSIILHHKPAKEINKIDWDFYKGVGFNNEELNSLMVDLELLKVLDNQVNHALEVLSENMVISHRDMDQKNILWDTFDRPMIIDWEAVGFINPFTELIKVALYWSELDNGSHNKDAFCTIIQA